jgi:hypothetical protein
MASASIRLIRNSLRPELPVDGWRPPRDELAYKADLCRSALTEARRQIASQRFGPALGQLLARASELQDDMDDALIALDPRANCDAFARVAALHRDLEAIQALLPREFRRQSRENRPVRG